MKRVIFNQTHSVAQIERIITATLAELLDEFVRYRYYSALASDVVVSANLWRCQDGLEAMLSVNSAGGSLANVRFELKELHELLRRRLDFTEVDRRAYERGYKDVVHYLAHVLMSIHVLSVIEIEPADVKSAEVARAVIRDFLKSNADTAAKELTDKILDTYEYMIEKGLEYV
jgi:HEPN domain-containing protein